MIEKAIYLTAVTGFGLVFPAIALAGIAVAANSFVAAVAAVALLTAVSLCLVAMPVLVILDILLD